MFFDCMVEIIIFDIFFNVFKRWNSAGFLLNHEIIVLQNAAAKEVEATQKKELAILKDLDLTQYEVKGSEHEWKQALSSGSKMISIKG